MVLGLDEELETRMKDIDKDNLDRAILGISEQSEIERRLSRVFPSPKDFR